MEPAVGSAACTRARARASQSCHTCRRTQACSLSVSRRQTGSALPATHALAHRPDARSRLKRTVDMWKSRTSTTGFPHLHSFGCCCYFYFELSLDLPAGSRLLGDYAEEFLLPMLPSVCFETGRFTQTQSSWTVPRHRSRKWMSGQAAALVAQPGRRKFTTLTALRKLPSAGESPHSLDFYLSWVSPVFLCNEFVCRKHAPIFAAELGCALADCLTTTDIGAYEKITDSFVHRRS